MNGRGAFTLIEILLALALGAVIIFTVGMAIDIHFRAVDSGRAQIEEAQLARTLMARIAADLRAAVQYDPQQAAKLLSKVADASSSAEKAAGAAGTDAATAAKAETTSETSTDSSTSTTPSSTPGLYGDSAQLQVDISRLPQLDRLQAATSSGTQSAGLTSDIKTVAWYLSTASSTTAGTPGELSSSTSTAGPQCSLLRRELDRAVAAWAAQNGSLAVDEGVQTVATEVTDLAFRYFDGSGWTDSWDSAQAGGLPSAVEVSLTLRRPPRGNSKTGSQSGISDNSATSVAYRQVVYLPGAHVSSSSADALGAGTSEESSTGDSSGQKSGDTGGGSGNSPGGNTGGNTGGGPSPPKPPAPNDPAIKEPPK